MGSLRRGVPAIAMRRLDTHLALVFGLTVVVALVSMVLFVNHRAERILDEATRKLFEHISDESRVQLDKSITSVDTLARLFASDAQATALDRGSREAFIGRMRTALDATPVASAIYVGYEGGGFLLLRQITSATARRNLAAPEQARYLLETLEGEGEVPGRAALTFLDASLDRIGTPDRPSFTYDPRQRDWYRAAQGTDDPILTEYYRFVATDEDGVTIARRLSGGAGVVGIDLSLADLSQELRKMKVSPSMELLIVDSRGAVIAASNPAAGDGSPVLSQMRAAAADAKRANQTSRLAVAGRQWRLRTVPLQAGPWTFELVLAMPQDEVLSSVRGLVVTLGWISFGFVVLVLLAIRFTAGAVSRPLVSLAREAEAIEAFHFKGSADEGVYSSVSEIDTLSRAIRSARTTIGRFIEIGRALAGERDPNRLMIRLLQETISITEAENGAILLSEDGARSFRIVTQNQKGEAEELSELATGPSRVSLADELGWIVKVLARPDITHFDSTEPMADRIFAGLTRDLVLKPGEVFRFAVIPLRDRSNQPIGGLVLVSVVQEEHEISADKLELARALSGNAAVAIETTILLKSRKSLLDAVIRMIAQSIDAKSPYTSGHCQRVPVITKALAQAACAETQGLYAGFDLTQDEWEAVDVACWLHDCGKLTTAEYVVDKATKLETITDRIHEIRMRFEVLKADAHAAYWRGLAEGGDEAQLRAARDRELAALDDDFAFVASCNEGGEFMAPGRIARLKAIAQRKWLRTLDDRLGVSQEERRRKNRRGDQALPVAEPLLADRPDQIIEHFSNQLDDLEKDEGFNLEKPPFRLNLGEIYNLSIARGTLTPEERYEINRHITRTIVMLRSLPLTGALRAVPELAGGHHEKMDGTGYPLGLRRDDMSLVARMMAIADVFEALTAADRPYKKAKPLSEVIRIMGDMKRDHHLDPDLLDLFIRSGVWRDYAERYLGETQADEPDVEAVLAIRPQSRGAA